MDIYKSWKIFGIYFYVSSIRMKRRRSIDEKMSYQRKVLRKKNCSYTSARRAAASNVADI